MSRKSFIAKKQTVIILLHANTALSNMDFPSWWSLFDHKIVITVVSAEIEIKGEKIWGMKKFRNRIKMKALKSKPIKSIELYWIVSQLCYIHVVLFFLLPSTKIDKDLSFIVHWCVLMFTVRKNYIWMGIKLFVSSIIQCVSGFNVLVNIFGVENYKSSICTYYGFRLFYKRR